MIRFGLCCISLKLKEQGLSHQTMTYKRFSSLPREEALKILGERIQNNLMVTNETIKFCAENNYVYRVSSDIFPLITYDEANVSLEDLPNYDEIQDEFDNIQSTISNSTVRVTCHPSEFNVLASSNQKAVDKTITELNFYSSFFDRIGLPADYSSPMNMHIHNKNGSHYEIIDRFMTNFKRLDENCRNRLVIENDDKLNCWSVAELITFFHNKTNIPITFDYLHHKCHPNGLDEESAIKMCHNTWHGYKPLFHYSESRPGNNPRAHADYAEIPFETYGLDFDLDMELKAKDLAIEKYEQICKGILV
ncbi:MAG: UV DNA damage repair endonuclease UvsE [Alphaproteobacteria bacterium]|jgi:UV DNA damage endonuclease|nr:UV DNA damage repair endonuclease UvsE [Alphaproteobacteria bacterium]